MDLLSRKISVRLTEKEYETLRMKMELSGYRSMSIFISVYNGETIVKQTPI